ncbi:hypothetical protein [Streptomyces sp. NPDC016172]|uniref:hypothetical protein n=1 Tax=Streptomyces sp. NPDC016172 TaxID=3364964 RepID=UPI0036FF0A34
MVLTDTMTYGISLPGVVEGIRARYAALTGKQHDVDAFAANVLGLRQGKRWQEAVSTALLGDWATPLLAGSSIGPATLAALRAEAQTIHRQLTPLWRRKANGSRVIPLDTPLGDGLTLYDMAADTPAALDLAISWLPEDVQLAAILAPLDAVERRVAVARAHPAVATWEEAALMVGAPDPAALGNRVRRKLKRLRDRHALRAAEAAARKAGPTCL